MIKINVGQILLIISHKLTTTKKYQYIKIFIEYIIFIKYIILILSIILYIIHNVDITIYKIAIIYSIDI